jgi:hypothetical protein
MSVEKVELKPTEAAPPPGQKLPEAVSQTSKGNTTVTTVDTTQKTAAKPESKDPGAELRPSWLPEEFKTTEEFVEHYKKNKVQTKPPDEKPAAETPKKDEKAPSVDVEKTVTDAGLNMSELEAEFSKDGKLSDASLEKLEKAGIKREQVDVYIEGQKAIAAQVTKRIADSIGGEENLNAALEWARENLSPAEIEAADKTIQMGEAQAKLVLAGIHSKRIAAVGQEPSRINGASGGRGADVQGYQSTAQMIADMNSAKYKTDEAFREQVSRRVAASQF